MPVVHLATYLGRRAQTAQHLLGGLKRSLPERSDVWPVIDLLAQSAAEAQAACDKALEKAQRLERLESELDLHRLATLAGPRARRIVARVARRLAS